MGVELHVLLGVGVREPDDVGVALGVSVEEGVCESDEPDDIVLEVVPDTVEVLVSDKEAVPEPVVVGDGVPDVVGERVGVSEPV